MCVLAVCAAGVWADAETNTHQKPGNSMPQKNVTLQLIGYTAKGTVPEGTEQVAFDDVSKVAYMIGGQNLIVIDLSSSAVDVSASTAKVVPVLTVRELPTTTTDVVMCGDLLAVSAEGATKVSPGQVLLYTRYLRAAGSAAASMKLLANFTVGALPDQIEFSKSCRTILVSNEGEPDCYDKPECSDPEGSVSVINIRPVYTSSSGKRCKAPRVAVIDDVSASTSRKDCRLTSVEGTVRTADFKAWNDKKDALIKQGLILDAPNGASVAQDLEPEYTTFSADEKIAFVSIQEANAMAILDVASAKITGLFPVGFKNHSLALNPLDPSDKDGGANIANWPVLGMFQADEIKAFSSKGADYIVAANEGDERDWDGYKQNKRLKDLVKEDLLDPAVFPNAKDTIGKDEALGRLNVYATVNAITDTDGDGKIDRILVNGARSFSIYKADRTKPMGRHGSSGSSTVSGLTRVFDSAAQLEQLSAALLPDVFNSEGTNETFDGRSDNKGPEPEGLAIGELPGSGKKSPARRILFLGTERLSVIFVYDITDPSNPVFQSIAKSPRPDANDLTTWLTGPEGMAFDHYTVSSSSSSKDTVKGADVDDVDAATWSRTTKVPIVLVAYEGNEHGGLALYRVSA